MSSRPFSPRFPWKLLNLFSAPRQRSWARKKISPPEGEIRLPFRTEQIRKRWVFLNEDGHGWPACGNVLAQLPGETTLFAPLQQSGVIHPGSTLRVFNPETFLIGSDEMNAAIALAQAERPDLVLCLDANPSLPMLFFAGQTGAPYRISFCAEEDFPFFNIALQAKSPCEWGALLARWIRPA